MRIQEKNLFVRIGCYLTFIAQEPLRLNYLSHEEMIGHRQHE